MQKSYVTNNHFRMVLNEMGDFLERGEEPPEELFADFINELKFSRLLIPGLFEGEDFISENIVLDDGATVIPLYTDDVEYIKDDNVDDQYDPVPNDILDYVDILNNNGGDGVVINPATEGFTIPIDLLNNFPLKSGITFKDNFNGGYSPEQLKNIAETTTNDSLVSFIRNPSNEDNFDGLMLELSKATLLNEFVSDEDFGIYATNGILLLDDVERCALSTISTEDAEFGILFTSKKAILDTVSVDDSNYYVYQITVLSEFIDFVLRQDMRGIIINPNLEEYFIPRYVLFNYSSILDNPSFKNAINYAFLE
ncbi:SseB family protein [uncultured Methanobrevibacter sp.]|uniref:SseB family protein n=1 Tax=uncultured Methanobrevibacter sp. TaxID=253161 RepID=UPI002605FF5B|nr:SseB family protein [uncultured Methanobrevibacter sp.]